MTFKIKSIRNIINRMANTINQIETIKANELRINSFKYFKLMKGSKVPDPKVYWGKKNSTGIKIDHNNLPSCTFEAEKIETKKYNKAIPCGSFNGIFVVDLDLYNIKDEETRQEYLQQIERLNTYTVKTPSGGFHLYFNYNEILDEIFKNLRITGVDFQTKGKYILAQGSIIKNYEQSGRVINGTYEVYKNSLIKDLDGDFEMFLQLQGLKDTQNSAKINPTTNLKTKITKKQVALSTAEYDFDCTFEDIKKVVETLIEKDPQCLTDHWKWKLLTAIMATHSKDFENIVEFWDKISEKDPAKYDKEENLKIWQKELQKPTTSRYHQGNFNINSLIYYLNKNFNCKLKFITRYKIYRPITEEVTYSIEGEAERLTSLFTYENFLKNKTIILDSGTATGKTTAAALYTTRLINENPNFKIMTITDKQALSDTHLESFEKVKEILDEATSPIELQDYRQNAELSGNFTVCINSLKKLHQLDEDDLENYIVYIDEVNSFIQNLTHNEMLDNVGLYSLFNRLLYIIRNCSKLIVSDACITDNVLSFCRMRGEELFYVKNKFSKYKNTTAYEMKNEDEFLEKIFNKIAKDEYFLFPSDSKSKLKKILNLCLLKFPAKKEQFLLIDSDYKGKLSNINELFKNKFVFFSPKILHGIDYNIPDLKEDVFLYIEGRSIKSDGLFQQICRQRNIDNLYYFNKSKPNPERYSSLDELAELVRFNIANDEFISKFNDLIQDRNTETSKNFQKLFLYNEYVKDLYNTNIKYHFEKILVSYGFKLQSRGKEKFVSYGALDNDLVERYIEDTNKENEIYDDLKKQMHFLGIGFSDYELIRKYADLLTDKYKMQDYLNFVSKYIKEPTFNEEKLGFKITSSMMEKMRENSTYKVLYIQALEKQYNLNLLSENVCNDEAPIEMSDELYNKLKYIFRCSKKKPTNRNELIKLWMTLLKNFLGNDLIQSSQLRTKENRDKRQYQLTTSLARDFINLYKLKNERFEGVKKDWLETLQINTDYIPFSAEDNL